MICYKDMTFCGFYTECKDAPECPRCLTFEVKMAAKAAGLQIAQFVEKPECFNPKKITK